MENNYIDSVKKVYSIIEPIGKSTDRRKKKQFFKQVRNWNSKIKYTEIYLPVEKKTFFFSAETKLNFNGEHAIKLDSLIDSIKFCIRRGSMTAIMYSLDPLNLVPERIKRTHSMVTSEVNTCLKQFLAYAFVCILKEDNIHNFSPSEHGEKLCEFLNEIGVME